MSADPLKEAARLYDLKQQRARAEAPAVLPFPADSYADLKAEEWEWLWTGRLPYGEVSFIEGYAGDGKSSVVADIVARISSGGALPGQDRRVPAGTIWFTTEESPTKTIIKRLQLAHANLANVRNINTAKLDSENTNLPGFTFPSGRGRLGSSIAYYGKQMGAPVRLVVIDGVLSIFDRGLEMNDAQDVRSMLGALRAVATEHNCAIVCIRHPSKSKGGLAQHRSSGSTAWNDFVRMSWLIGQEPGTDHGDYRRVMVPVKKNAGRAYPGLKFHTSWIEEAGEVRVDWDDLCDLTADEVYAAREEQRGIRATDDQIKQAVAELRGHDASKLTLRKAKNALEGTGLPGDAVAKALQMLKRERRGSGRQGEVGGD